MQGLAPFSTPRDSKDAAAGRVSLQRASRNARRAIAIGTIALAIGPIGPPAPSDAAGRPGERAAEPKGTPPPLFAPFERPPLDPPVRVTGGFGEYRVGHFHAGFDFGTGGQVGQPVYAPVSGYVERVRASGVGYGRSIYLHTEDGRLLQFGHLDAFAEPLASYVAAMQESTGQYEQDLWPEARRFAMHAGDRIAWTGESGAGGPHMHFEVRRGDVAYQPSRAGLVVPDSTPPSLASLTLEPLDDTSYVERGTVPYTIAISSGRPDTVTVQGRVRALVGARDGVWRGVDRMVPWSIGMEFAGHWTEARFDSISWATEMSEGDYVFDAGRVRGEKEVVLWAPAGFRPRVLVADAPQNQEAGTIAVRPGDPPRVLRIVTRDLGGGKAERRIVVRGPARSWRPDTSAAGSDGKAGGDPRIVLASLPGGFVRVEVVNAPPRSRAVLLEVSHGRLVPMTQRRGTWAAVVAIPRGGQAIFDVAGRDVVGRRWRVTRSAEMTEVGAKEATVGSLDRGADWRLPSDGAFERSWVAASFDAVPPTGSLDRVLGTGDKRVTSMRLEPGRLPLRSPARVRVRLPEGADPKGVAIYRHDGSEWEHIMSRYDSSSRVFECESRRLGTFTLLRDRTAPTVEPLAARSTVPKSAYPRWSLEARLGDGGSGVDARATYFEVDGKRAPSEWDSEEGVLRWKPHRAPKSGTHRYQVVAADRAGNTIRTRGSFVLD